MYKLCYKSDHKYYSWILNIVTPPTLTLTDIDAEVGLTRSLDSCSGAIVYSGSTVTLRCTPTGFPAPTLVWLLNESPVLGSNIALSEDGHVITIAGIYGNQTGQWQCRPSNVAGSAVATIELQVNGTFVH